MRAGLAMQCGVKAELKDDTTAVHCVGYGIVMVVLLCMLRYAFVQVHRLCHVRPRDSMWCGLLFGCLWRQSHRSSRSQLDRSLYEISVRFDIDSCTCRNVKLPQTPHELRAGSAGGSLKWAHTDVKGISAKYLPLSTPVLSSSPPQELSTHQQPTRRMQALTPRSANTVTDQRPRRPRVLT